MDSKDNKDDNQKSELPLLGQPEKPMVDQDQTSNLSQSKSGTTQSVAESMARIRNQLGEGQGKQKPSITLNILGLDTPITFHDRIQITLGRKNPSTNEEPDVDLSGLPLNSAGISRKHLNLVFTNGQWYAEDLGSRNGSWLNSKLLMAYQRYKLQDGDQLRTGGISIIVLTHADETQSQKPKLTSNISLPNQLKLTCSTIIENQQGLRPAYITNQLMPYLEAVIDMIQHVDRAKKRPQREISIESMEFDHPMIRVRLTCAHEVLKFMSGQAFVKPLSEPSSAVSEVTQAIETFPRLSEFSATADQSDTLAQQFAEEYFPLITADQSLYYQRLLAPLLAVCIESDIRIAS